MSVDLLSVLSEHESYERYAPFIKEHVVGDEIWQIIKDLSDYYDTGEETVDWQRFGDWFKSTKHPNLKPSKIEIYDSIFRAAKNFEPTDLTEAIMEGLIKRDYCTKIADLTLRGAEGDDVDMHEVATLMDAYETQSKDANRLEDYFVTGSIEDVIESTTTGGLNWPQEEMQWSCGPVRLGDFLVFAARPDAGKTTWAAFNAGHFAKQSDLPIVWFNNEQEGRKVKARFVQAVIGWTTSEMRSNPIGAKDAFVKIMGRTIDEVILVFDKAAINPRDVEQVLRKQGACVIVFDQLYKFHGFEKQAANEVGRQAALFQWAREICKEHAPVIALHQANGEAEGKEWIDMGQLYGSKTAIQGEVDLLITMGRSAEPTKQDTRFIQFPKNKMAGGDNFKEEERHSRWEFTFDPMRARFT